MQLVTCTGVWCAFIKVIMLMWQHLVVHCRQCVPPNPAHAILTRLLASNSIDGVQHKDAKTAFTAEQASMTCGRRLVARHAASLNNPSLGCALSPLRVLLAPSWCLMHGRLLVQHAD